jgi:hypothetical protein
MKKSQAALEFLSTYAWAFIVIGITMGALYYSGIFDFSKYLPQKCTFPLQFKCLDFGLAPGTVRIKLINNLGEDIKVNQMSITNEAALALSCTGMSPSLPFDWVHSTEKDIEFTSCSGGGYVPGERVDLKVQMAYHAVNTPSKPSHTINGRINGKVTS